MSDELIKVVNFDGFISHVSDSGEGSEVIIYVAHVVSDDSRIQEGGKTGAAQDLFNCEDHVSNNDNNFGTIFTIRVGQCVERVAAKDISENERLTKVRLIDKGIDVEVERNALFPSTSCDKIDTDCMCPILVIDAGEEQREVAAQISGRECRCINGNLVVIPSVGLCVKGRLLVSYGNGGYAELKDISLVPAEGQEKFTMEDISESNVNMSPMPKHTEPFRYHCDSIACRRNALGGNGEKYEQGEYDDMMNAYGNEACTFTENHFTNQCNNQFDRNSAAVGNGMSFDRHNYDEGFPGARFDCDREEMDDMYVMESRSDLPYKQHAFKEYVPYVYPRTMRIRFDKIDSSLADTFSVFEPNIFTTVERILHEGRQRYSTCPQFDMSLVHQLNGVGCLVKASVDSGCRSLCRAEIIKFANSTNRFSVYLVDYGFYKWIKFNDVFDISVINKRDKILFLPVALFHCRLEKCANGIRLQHLEKGGEYEITIKSRDSEGIFNVHIDRIDDDDGNEDTLTNTRDSLVSFNFNGYSNFFAPWCSCSSLQCISSAFLRAFQRNMEIGEVLRRNSLMSTMITNIPFSTWSKPGICGFGIPYPMIMPVMVPTILNFGEIISRNQGNRSFAQFGQGDNARDSFFINKDMRTSYRRGYDRSWNCEEGRYRPIECNREFDYNDNFEESINLQNRNTFGQTFHRNNGCWGRRGERNITNRGCRSGKYGPHINTDDLNAAHENFSSDGPEYANPDMENKRSEPIACSESSEQELPPQQNQHVNPLADFDKNTTGNES
ncbi:unnamed protein product [Brugia timori]|uniref:Tudor domain-containing protein n=1 Tax=Brugia timori TaxID=42155 RepID=A0A0R3QUD4_9BILA|nr:unnamed protein product [Brugia timori]